MKRLLTVALNLFLCTSEVSSIGHSDITIQSERERCGEIIDAHLHLASWFSTAEELVEELTLSSVTRGILYAVYAPITFPGMKDANEEVSSLALASDGKIVGLASLNTTGNWDEEMEEELGRLGSYLERDEFVGAKLAPPHTCLEMGGEIMEDVVETIANSSKPVLAVHVGTTPFCGPIGKAIGLNACCTSEYVDPSLLSPLIESYPNVSFVLLHSGFDFLPPGDELNYNGTLVDAAIDVADAYPNVYLEISGLLSQDVNGNLSRPGGLKAIQKIADAGLKNKMISASDANHYKGVLKPTLENVVNALVEAGFEEDERCESLGGLTKKVFGMGELEDEEQKSIEEKKNEANDPNDADVKGRNIDGYNNHSDGFSLHAFKLETLIMGMLGTVVILL